MSVWTGKPTIAKRASACLAFPGPQGNARILELREKLKLLNDPGGGGDFGRPRYGADLPDNITSTGRRVACGAGDGSAAGAGDAALDDARLRALRGRLGLRFG